MIAMPARILPAGLHDGIPSHDYHADPCARPSLSSGIARTILAKSLAHAYAEHPRLGNVGGKETSPAMERGQLVHALMAGELANNVEIGRFSTFRSKAAQEWADSVRAAGKLPALADDYAEALEIAAALEARAFRGITCDTTAERGFEVTAVWENNGALYRARYDLLERPQSGPWTIWDWKVTSDVSVAAVKRQMRRFRYDQQAAHYLAGADALCPQFAGLHSFVFVFVEDAPPYSVRRYCLKPDSLATARLDITHAHELWWYAMTTGEWPDASLNMTTHIDVPVFNDEEDDEIAT